MVKEFCPCPETGSTAELHLVPTGPLDVANPDQAETYVHRLKAEYLANIYSVALEPSSYDFTLNRDHASANAFASMAIADRLYEIAPKHHPEYSPLQARQANLAIELVIEAREKIVPPSEPPLGHLGRPQDLWADEIVSQLKQRKELERKRGKKKLIDFPKNPIS